MKPMRGMVLFGALAGLLTATAAAEAGWKSVYDVTCFHKCAPAVSGYAPAPVVAGYSPCCPQPVCCPPAPQQVCTTNYIQRTYYQPVTSYRTTTYYEPVTSYRTSYYWEPTTCYRYRSYYDPCTCCWKQTATPYTSYKLRSQCNAVTNYVQRCGYEPVTTWQKSCYWEPQTCCQYVDPCTGAVIPTAAPQQPAVTENPPAVPRVTEYPPNGQWQPYKPPPPEGSGSSYKPKLDPVQVPPDLDKPRVPAIPKADKIALYEPKANGGVTGKIVGDRDAPKAGAQLVFVPDASSGKSVDAKADQDGKFQTNLADGKYLVYVRDGDGRAVYHSTVQVKSSDNREMRLVSR